MDNDSEMDKLINFLFPNLNSEDTADPKFQQYLNKLNGMTIEKLLKEKKTLDEEVVAIDNQMRNLALSNYKSFIHTAEVSHSTHKNIISIENRLTSFLNETPKLQNGCETFMNESAEIKERRRKNNLILSNSAEILQILEIPQFMNACIREEHYEEALLLPAFVKRLTVQHSDIALIKSIAEDVNKSWWELMRQLLRHLSSDISLPKCLQIVGYLHRMNIFSDVELRLKFLQARGFWLDSLLASIPNDNQYNYLSAVIDITRVSIFSITTQYKAVFTDDEVITKQNDLKNSIFHSWLNKKVNDFLNTIEANLPFCPASSLDSLLGQCMYFGQSFGRIGSDFRALVINVFVTTIENNFETAIRKVDEQFVLNMRKFILPKLNFAANIALLKEPGTDKQFLSPPLLLLEYYPLAVYCNGVLSAFNELRYCAPVGCVTRVTSVLQQSLIFVSKNLSLYYEKENVTWLDEEREMYHRMYTIFRDDFMEFVRRCLMALFEAEKTAKYFGLSLSYLEDEICNLRV